MLWSPFLFTVSALSRLGFWVRWAAIYLRIGGQSHSTQSFPLWIRKSQTWMVLSVRRAPGLAKTFNRATFENSQWSRFSHQNDYNQIPISIIPMDINWIIQFRVVSYSKWNSTQQNSSKFKTLMYSRRRRRVSLSKHYPIHIRYSIDSTEARVDLRLR